MAKLCVCTNKHALCQQQKTKTCDISYCRQNVYCGYILIFIIAQFLMFNLTLHKTMQKISDLV